MTQQVSIPSTALTSVNFTALSPSDGDIAILQVDTTFGVNWMFRYNASSSSSYKWEFIGGPPIQSTGWNQSTSSATPVTCAGPTAGINTVPRAGDYFVAIGGYVGGGSQSGQVGIISTSVGTIQADAPGNSASASIASEGRIAGLSAGTAINLMLSDSNASSTVSVSLGYVRITPIRVQ